MNTMNEAVEAVEVTQADRVEAAAIMALDGHNRGWSDDAVQALTGQVLAGHYDHEAPIQAFARHRIASVAAARPLIMEEAAGIVRRELAMVVLQNAESASLQWIEGANFASDRAQEAIRTAAKTDGAAHDR